MEAAKKSRWKLYALGAVAAYGAIATVIAVRHAPSRPTEARSDARLDKAEDDFKAQERLATAQAKQIVSAQLKDPSSAEFDHTSSQISHGERVSCGTVNARNSFGGMSGAERWIVIPGKGIATIQSFENVREIARLWNRYCADTADRSSSAPPAEFLSVKLGARTPSDLQPFDGARQVWVYKAKTTHTYLGVPVDDPWFTVEHGRVSGGGASTKGRDAYERLRGAMFTQFGMPAFDGGQKDPRVHWDWGGKPLAQLSYSEGHDQTSMILSARPSR